MKRRTRVLAGTLALVAMALSFAETVIASVCAPMVDAADMSEMADMAVMRAGAPAAMDGEVGDRTPPAMDCLLTRGHGTDPDGGDRDDHCPLSPVVGQGCTAVASLPGSPSDAGSPPDHGALRIVFDDIRPDLLLSHALFRPPRA